jgi:hypothetical protein
MRRWLALRLAIATGIIIVVMSVVFALARVTE